MKRIYPWLMAVLISIVGLIQIVFTTRINYIEQSLFFLNIVLIAFLGALIIDRQRGNRVGWLMVGLGLLISLPGLHLTLRLFPLPPAILTPGIWLLLWLQSWTSWLLPILITHIMFRFPDGRLLSERWNWITPVTFGTIFVLAFLPMFRDQIGPINGTWEVDNPLGFISQNAFESISILWVIGLAGLAVGSLISLFSRYRRGGVLERAQIRWLLFAGTVIIAMVGISLAVFSATNDSPFWLDILFPVSLMVFPLAIANAIFRYRLYEIDIIIRRTLQYTLLTGVLVLIYYGGIVFLQGLFRPMTGDVNSPLITVITTLGIAALFNPLRIRIQGFIDRRFFRNKYDAEKALDEFASITRDEVDIDRLSVEIISLVDETMQPDHVGLWLRQARPKV